MQNPSNRTLHTLQTTDNIPVPSLSSDESFADLSGNKQYNVALYAGVIIGTKTGSLENTGFCRLNPNYEKG